MDRQLKTEITRSQIGLARRNSARIGDAGQSN